MSLEHLLELNGIESNKAVTVEDLKKEAQADKERIAQLEAQNEMLTECILELADIIYA